MKKKIFVHTFLLGALVLLLCAVLFFSLQYYLHLEVAAYSLLTESAYVAPGPYRALIAPAARL